MTRPEKVAESTVTTLGKVIAVPLFIVSGVSYLLAMSQFLCAMRELISRYPPFPGEVPPPEPSGTPFWADLLVIGGGFAITFVTYKAARFLWTLG